MGDNRVVELLLALRDSLTVSLRVPADTTWRWELVVRQSQLLAWYAELDLDPNELSRAGRSSCPIRSVFQPIGDQPRTETVR